MASECSIIRYFKTKNLKILPRHLQRLDPRAFGTCPPPPFKILDLSLAPATVLAAAPTLTPSLGRRLEAAPATVTSAVAVAPADAWAGFQPSGPQSP